MMVRLTKADGKMITVNSKAIQYMIELNVDNVGDGRWYNTVIVFAADHEVHVRENVEQVLKILGSENGGKSLQDE